MRLVIKRAVANRDLYQHRYYGRDELVEVEMSPTQYAEAITHMNMGSGVPCTIRRVGRQRMEDPPPVDQRQLIESEFAEKMGGVAAGCDGLLADIKELFEKKNLTKADRASVLGQIEKLLQEVRNNVPFVHSQFNEAMDKTVTECKGEVEAFMLRRVIEVGQQALLAGQVGSATPPALPDFTKKG